jgi:hypothetical protein
MIRFLGTQMTVFQRGLTAFFLCLAANTAFSQVAFPVPRPDIKVGDRWKIASLDGLSKLQDGLVEWRVTAVEPGIFHIAVKSGTGEGSERFDAEWNAFQDVKGKQERQLKNVFPLEVGKTWDTKYEWMNPRGHHGRMELSFKVGAPERVTVPAGTFDTVPIDARGYWYNLTTGASGAAVEKRWYAPLAKSVIRRTWVTRYADGRADQNRLFELQEIQLAP